MKLTLDVIETGDVVMLNKTVLVYVGSFEHFAIFHEGVDQKLEKWHKTHLEEITRWKRGNLDMLKAQACGRCKGESGKSIMYLCYLCDSKGYYIPPELPKKSIDDLEKGNHVLAERVAKLEKEKEQEKEINRKLCLLIDEVSNELYWSEGRKVWAETLSKKVGYIIGGCLDIRCSCKDKPSWTEQGKIIKSCNVCGKSQGIVE